MKHKIACDAFEYHIVSSTLVLAEQVRFFDASVVNAGQELSAMLHAESIGMMTIDIHKTQYFDLKSEAFLLDIARYFVADFQKQLIAICSDEKTCQQNLLAGLLKVNPNTKLDYLVNQANINMQETRV